MLLCWVLFTTLLGIYLDNVSPENSIAIDTGLPVKDFITNKEKENVEKQNIRPPNKFQKSTENSSFLRGTLNWKTSNTEDKIESENGKFQSFQNHNAKRKEPNGALMLHSEAAATQVGKQSFAKDTERVKTVKMTNVTSFQVKNKQYFTTAKDPNSDKTPADTVQWTETTSAHTMFNFTSSSSDQSAMQKIIPTSHTENIKTNATNNEIHVSVLKNKGRRSIYTIPLSKSKSKNWFVAFYTQTQ